MRRRNLLKAGVTGTAWLASGASLLPKGVAAPPTTKEIRADIAIIGGGLGGCAAALAALRQGRTVILTEGTDWVGGQATSQAVPFDEHRWIEKLSNRSYASLIERIRGLYRRNYPLSEAALAEPALNPGLGGVSRICCEPRVVLSALEEMLAPYRSSGALTLLLEHVPVEAHTEQDRLLAVTLENRRQGNRLTLCADYFLDATELGDLLPLAGVEYVSGAESRGETGELHAPLEARPENHQAFTCCFAMDHLPGENHTIDRPEEYDFWRGYVPKLSPAWTGPLLSWDNTHPVTLEKRTHKFDPDNTHPNEAQGLWRYRRIFYTGHYREGFSRSDISLVNWPQNDYFLGNLYGGTEEEVTLHLRRGKQLSLSLLYWMQTEAPRPDGGTGWPGLRLRPDIVGTGDGLAKHPYIRESRRIKALFTVLEKHVGKQARVAETGLNPEEVRAARFEDSVGIGYYRIDLHPSSGGDNYIDIDSLPFEIPLGALIPIRMKNLLAACKNIGTTHITNGCYRLHPVEWNIGEAAGLLASRCLAKGNTPHQIQQTPEHLSEFQSLLEREGIPLRWPEGL